MAYSVYKPATNELLDFIDELVNINQQVMFPLLMFSHCHALPRVAKAAGFDVEAWDSKCPNHTVMRWLKDGNFYDARGLLGPEALSEYEGLERAEFRRKYIGMDTRLLLMTTFFQTQAAVDASYRSQKTIIEVFGKIPKWYENVMEVRKYLPKDAEAQVAKWRKEDNDAA